MNIEYVNQVMVVDLRLYNILYSQWSKECTCHKMVIVFTANQVEKKILNVN